jgi:hypothetical protein
MEFGDKVADHDMGPGATAGENFDMPELSDQFV